MTWAAPAEWNPGGFRTHIADLAILPLAVLWLPWAARRRPVWAAWAEAGLLFLAFWPTRWAQYTLLVLPALGVCGGIALQEIVRGWWRSWVGERLM